MTFSLTTESPAAMGWTRLQRTPPRLPSREGQEAGGGPAAPGTAAGARAGAAAPAEAVIAAARRLLMTRDYSEVTYKLVAREAGVDPSEVRAACPAKMELVLAALGLRGTLRAAAIARLSGREVVLQYLRFWDRDGNAAIIRRILAAAAADDRVVRDIETYLTATLLRPLSWGLRTPDACPRVRLLVSTLTGLSFSRYVLKEEPLASGDPETVASWMGPVVDGLLRGSLQAAG